MGSYDSDEGDDDWLEGDDLPRDTRLFGPVGDLAPRGLVVGHLDEVAVGAVVTVPQKKSVVVVMVVGMIVAVMIVVMAVRMVVLMGVVVLTGVVALLVIMMVLVMKQ